MLRKIALAVLALALAGPPVRAIAPADGMLLGFLAKDAATGALLSGSHDVTVNLYDTESAGTPLWAESHQPSFSAGFAGLNLGAFTPFPGTLPASPLPLYLGITVDGGAELAPRIPLNAQGGDIAPFPLELLSFSRPGPAGAITASFTIVDASVTDFDGGTVGFTAKDAGGAVLHAAVPAAGTVGGSRDLTATTSGVPSGTALQAVKRTLHFGMTATLGGEPVVTGLAYPLPVTLTSATRAVELLWILPPGATPPASPGGNFGYPGAAAPSSFAVTKASVQNALAPAADRVSLKALLPPAGESGPAYDPATEGLTIRIGEPEDPYVLEIAAGDPAWKASPAGNSWKWRSPPGAAPAVSLSLNAAKGTLVLALSAFDFPSPPAQALLVSVGVGDDLFESGFSCEAKFTFSGGR